MSRQGKYWWCWADIYDLVDNHCVWVFLIPVRIRHPLVSVIPKPFFKNHWVDFTKEPEVLTDYLISFHIIRALGSFRNRTDTRRRQMRFSSTRLTRVFKSTLSLFHVLKKRRGKKKNRKRADINEVTSVTY